MIFLCLFYNICTYVTFCSYSSTGNKSWFSVPDSVISRLWLHVLSTPLLFSFYFLQPYFVKTIKRACKERFHFTWVSSRWNDSNRKETSMSTTSSRYSFHSFHSRAAEIRSACFPVSRERGNSRIWFKANSFIGSLMQSTHTHKNLSWGFFTVLNSNH